MVLHDSGHIGSVLVTVLLLIFFLPTTGAVDDLVAPGADIVHLAGGFTYTEGPTANTRGDVFFTDSRRDKILRWSVEGELSTFRQPAGGAVGLFFDHEDNLIICAGSDKKLVSIDPEGIWYAWKKY